MKIVFLSIAFRFFSSEAKIGGGEISNRDLLYCLAESEDVIIISAYGGGGWGVMQDGVKSYEIAALLNKLPVLNFFSITLAKCFFKYITLYKVCKLQPDILLGGTYSAYVIDKYKKIDETCRTGFFIRAFENLSVKKMSLLDSLKKLVYGDYGIKTLKKMDFIIANSQFMKGKCLEKGISKNKLKVIYPGISVFKNKNKNKNNIKNKIKIKMISTRADKGFDIFCKLALLFPDYDFEAAGDSEVIGEKKIYANLSVYGWLNNPNEFIATSDVFLVPSLVEETFGRVSVEAILAGVFTIVSSKGGLPETVNHNELFIVKESTVESWAQKIKFILDVENVEKLNSDFCDLQEFSELFKKEYQMKCWKEIIKKEYSNRKASL